jgi:hypothetical protein
MALALPPPRHLPDLNMSAAGALESRGIDQTQQELIKSFLPLVLAGWLVGHGSIKSGGNAMPCA